MASTWSAAQLETAGVLVGNSLFRPSVEFEHVRYFGCN